MAEQSKALSRKAQGEETRATLINTGARLFALNGYHGVSMRTLVKEAGVNLSTVGYHFGGKSGLYEAILQELVDIRADIFPTEAAIEERMAGTAGNPQALADGVSWYMNRLVHGILGNRQHIWAVFIISRELAQPSELYHKLEKEFFNPTFASMHTFVAKALPEAVDHEELVITSHCIIGMLVKFLEGSELITNRLNWDGYEGHGVEKIAAVLSKRTRGFFGLPMENA